MNLSRESETVLRVIEGEGDAEGQPVRRRPRERFCNHFGFELGERERRVYCGKCEQEIDAFDALVILATRWERINGRYKHAVSEAKRAEAHLDDLKRQERNAKARVRRAS